MLGVENRSHSHHRWDGSSTYSSVIYHERHDFHRSLRLLHSSASLFSSDDGKSKVELAVEAAKAKKEKKSETTEVSVIVCIA